MASFSARLILVVVAIVALASTASALRRKANPSSSENLRPTIGVFMEPSPSCCTSYGSKYIAASYIKFVEGGGARAVPIDYTQSEEELTEVFNSINGLLFPGGGVDLEDGNQWDMAGAFMIDLAMTANQKGDYFPVWGTCLGFEFISVVVSANDTLLQPTNTENVSYALTFESGYGSSRLYGGAPKTVIDILETQAVTLNNHMYSLTTQAYSENAKLASMQVLSTNVGRNGTEFVSSMEHKTYPIYATQFHPEKVLYEWNPTEAIDHSTDSVLANQYFANFFVSEARKNFHTFANATAEYDAMIYNYNPVYTEDLIADFEQCYFFP